MKARYVLCGILALLAAPLGAGTPDRLTMRVTPPVAVAPANLYVRTTIAPDAQNRSIEIIAESGGFYRTSEVVLDGDNAPRTSEFEFRGLPGGTYTVAAVLKGANGAPLAQLLREVNVVASPAGH
jgi:hypothetical protein